MDDQLLNLPEITPVIVAIWGICIFVILYFYRHAERKNRAVLFSTLTGTTALFFFILVFFWQRERIQFNPKRVAVYPFLAKDAEAPRLDWRSLALSESPIRYLSGLDPKAILTYQSDWLFAAANADSFPSHDYLIDFSRRIHLDYAVLGEFRSVGFDQLQVHVQLYDLSSGRPPVEQDLTIPTDKLPQFGYTLSEFILAKMSDNSQNGLAVNEAWSSPEQFRNYYSARQNYLQKNPDVAAQFAELAVQQDSSSLACLNLLAELDLQLAFEQKQNAKPYFAKFAEAKRLLLKSLSLRQENSTALRLLGELYILNKKWTQAETYLKQAFQINSWDPHLLFDFTQLHPDRYKDLGFSGEKSLLRRAILINPCFFEARFALANYYHEQEDRYDLAIRGVQEVLRINPESIDGLMALGKFYMAKNELLNVLQTYEKVVQLDPGNADAYYNLGIVYYDLKDYENSIQFFKRAIQINNHPDAHLYLAYIYELQGNMDSAIEQLRIRIRLQKNEEDRFGEEARKHLFKIMQSRGVIDSLYSNSNNRK